MERWTEEEIAFIIEQKEEKRDKFGKPLQWVKINEAYNKKFRLKKGLEDRGFESIRKCYRRYENYFEKGSDKIQSLKKLHRTRKSNSVTARENKTILQLWNERDDILETIENTIKSVSLRKYKIPTISKSKKKRNMTMELLFSDVHYGKLIRGVDGKNVDHKEIRRRVQKIATVMQKEIIREGKSFNVERLILAMIGDLIENAEMHGMESVRGSEFGTSKQVTVCIESIFYDLIMPLALTGIKIDIPCVTGNHDRIGKDKTYSNPGEENLTHTIYNTLEMLCKQSGLKNVTFTISTSLYMSINIYDNVCVYEHGDELKNLNRDTMANLMSKRGSQLNKVVDFYRVGHWHESVSYGQGKMMVNGSVPGQDSYADSKGFNSEAIQILNYYVETKSRSTCFFRSFPIYLEKKND